MAAPPSADAVDLRTASIGPAVVLAALGVVFGDIGTSPLYALREAVAGPLGTGISRATVLGVLSMLFWSVTVVVSVKYVLLVLNADNQGEGGVLALLAGVLRQAPEASPYRRAVIVAGLLGAAMFYGDAVITPAISVLAAVEGLEVVAPGLHDWVVPLALLVLCALFVPQRHGTERIGRLFGPVMLLWFVVLATLGMAHIVRVPDVLHAIVPLYALVFAAEHPWLTLAVTGAVFLAVTGGEAMYADLGHFGARPIRVAWLAIVMPALLLNYFGQGAALLADPAAVENPLLLMAPGWFRLPLLLLATAASVIASQAVIAGAFSLTAQAARLGYLPRLPIVHTSAREAGQVYVPLVNWLLLALVAALVVGFGSSSALAAAYGIAVSVTMLLTTLGVMVIAHGRWGWSAGRTLAVFVPLVLLDIVFVVANTLKIEHGGWFPLAFGALLLVLLITWQRGRALLLARHARGAELAPFIEGIAAFPPARVAGTAVFMTPGRATVPTALLHNLKHNRVLHERVILMTAQPENVPKMPPELAAQVRELGHGFFHVRVRLGFQDEHDIARIARNLAEHHGLALDVADTSFFLSRQTLLVRDGIGMAKWRKRLFRWMARNAQPASDFFGIPPNRVIEIGTQTPF